MDTNELRSLQEAYLEVVENQQQLDEVSDRKVRAVRDAREKQWNKQFGKNRVQDPTDDMVDKVDKLIDQRNKRTGSKVKKTTMGQLRDKLRREQVDIYDIILSHLLDEGYADTVESAEGIMLNMSEEWRDSIVEEVISEGKIPLDKERRARIGRQIGKRIDSAGKDLAGSGAPFMPKSIRNNLRQSAVKKTTEVSRMEKALKSAQKHAKEEYMDEGRWSVEKYG